MDLPSEFLEVMLAIIAVSIGMVVVDHFTKKGRNFRSSRNKKARKQF